MRVILPFSSSLLNLIFLLMPNNYKSHDVILSTLNLCVLRSEGLRAVTMSVLRRDAVPSDTRLLTFSRKTGELLPHYTASYPSCIYLVYKNDSYFIFAENAKFLM
jgi:hypothetical protein